METPKSSATLLSLLSVDLLPAAIYTCDREGKITYANRRAWELWGLEGTEVGTLFYCGWVKYYLRTSEIDVKQRPVALVLETLSAVKGVQATVLRKDGTRLSIVQEVDLLRGSGGEVVGTVSVFQTVELDQLTHAERRLAALVESSDDAIVSKDLNGIVTSWNGGAKNIFGYTSEEMVGRSIMQLIPDDRKEEEVYILDRIRRGLKTEHYETVRVGKNGLPIPVSLSVSPIKDATGRIIGASKIARDISLWKRTEENLNRRTRTLESLNQVAGLLVGERNLEAIVQGVTDAGRNLSGAAFGAFFYNIRDEQGEHYTLYTLSGVPREAFSKFPMPRNTAIFGPTFRGEGVVRSDDITQDPRYGKNAPHQGMPAGHLPVRSYLAVPVISRSGEVIGGLFFGHGERGVFTKESEESITTLAAQAAIAIDNASLHKTAERELNQQRIAKAAATEREHQLRLVTDHAPVYLVQMDRESRYKFVNQPYADRFGHKAEDLIGEHLSKVVGAEALSSFQHHVAAVLAGQRVEFEMEIPYDTLGRRWVHVIYVPERDAGANVVGFVAVITDITLRKVAEKELERVRDEALAASKAKDDFLAALSHELRTPLNPVLLLSSDGAVNPALPPSVREDFDSIRKNIELEARLIDDLLDLTRITHNKLVLERRDVDVHQVIRDALSAIKPEAALKELEISVDLRARRHCVSGDSVRLQQIFWNVLKNAVKFTQEGKVSIRSEEDSESGTLSVVIADTGIGMTPPEIGRIFEAFTQGDHAQDGPSHRFGGLGLGLAISRSLVELHGGSVKAASQGRDRGSVFTIQLPLAVDAARPGAEGPVPTQPDAPDTRDTAEPASHRLLVVDDHAPTRTTLKSLLSRRGYEVAIAANCEEAIAIAALQPFDLLISDIGLPDGDGCALIAELRKRQPGLRGIALSGYGMEDDLARTLAAGFAEHLTKPVDTARLQDAIRRMVGV